MSAIGLRVGSYEIVGRTRVPEPGDWHLARRTDSSRRGPAEVLVRLLPPDASADDREALHHQYEVLRALEDARVPDAVEFYEGLGAMAVAAVHGTSLEDIVRGRDGDVIAMNPSTLLDIVLELAETMQRAHHRNRFHGDLSPDRVLLAADGRLWVFGFGQPLGATPHPDWVAPELHDGQDSGPAADQWHLGVLTAALVGGGTPWRDGGNQIERLLEPVERQWPALGRLLERMTASNPADRYPSMHPVRQELLALARKAGGASARRELGGDMARPRALDISGSNQPMPQRTPVAAPPRPTPETSEAPSAPERPPDGFALPGGGHEELPEELPTPDVEVDLTISDEYEIPQRPPPTEEPLLSPDPATEGHRTPHPAPRSDLPHEDFVVVRPDVGTEVPTAQLQHTAPQVDPWVEEVALASVDSGLDDIQPRGLGVPLSPPSSDPSDDDVLVAGVVIEPSDPDVDDPPVAADPPAALPLSPPFPDADMNNVPSTAFPSVPSNIDEDLPVEPNPFATDMGADVAADAASAPGTGDGMSWDDLAREFATDMGEAVGGGETILPPNSHPSAFVDGDIEPSAETEQSEPVISAISAGAAKNNGPGSDTSLGIGAVDSPLPNVQVQGLSDVPTGAPKAGRVPTSTLVERLAPAAVAVFLLLFVVWLGMQLLG